MSKIKVTVSKVSDKAGERGNYIHTVKTEGKVVEVLGQKKSTGQVTYFISLPSKTAIGSEHEIDMDQFDVKERDFVTADRETGEEIVLKLKWLHLKP